MPFALAGGLNAHNVAEAISIATPEAVDVASGVEKATHGQNTDSMVHFVARAKAAFAELD